MHSPNFSIWLLFKISSIIDVQRSNFHPRTPSPQSIFGCSHTYHNCEGCSRSTAVSDRNKFPSMHPISDRNSTPDQNGQGDSTNSVFGLILTTLHPPPPPLAASYSTFQFLLQAALDQAGVSSTEYTLYPIDALHCTIATFHPFSTPSPPNPGATISAWSSLLDTAIHSPLFRIAMSSTPSPRVRVKGTKVFDDGVGVLLYDDSDAIISKLRDALRHLRSSKQFTLEHEINVAEMRIPDIHHSTVFRWHRQPAISTAHLQTMFDRAYETAFDDIWSPLSTIKLMRELQPFMTQRTCCKTVTTFPTPLNNNPNREV